MGLKRVFFTLLPKNLVSFFIGKLVHIPFPEPLASWSKAWFVSRYQIRMSEAEHPVSHYRSIGEVFTRHLRAGARPIAEAPFVHPVDGVLSRVGTIQSGDLIQAKGKSYSLSSFLTSEVESKKYADGMFLTYYLCPTDYHRVHSPVDAEIISCVHVPGRLWPVNPWSVENISQVFSVNERVVIHLKTPRGPLAFVMVGATNVGKMTMSFDSEIVTNASHWREKKTKTYSPPIAVSKGQELGVFNMGSTVIVIAPRDYFSYLPKGIGESVRLGQELKFTSN